MSNDTSQSTAESAPPSSLAGDRFSQAARKRSGDGFLQGGDRLDDLADAWPLRPWLLAALCAVAGFAFYVLMDVQAGSRWRAEAMGLAAFVAVGTVSFALGVERQRMSWAVAFSIFWGAVIGLICWRIAGLNSAGDFFGWPLFSGLLAVLIATPFFQARRDVADNGKQWRLWELPYARLHEHAWTDGVIGAAAVLFAGITLLLGLLIGGMFNLIGISFLGELMEKGVFVLPLAGAAFGGAVGLLRDRDRLVSVMQRLVMVVLSVLAPVLAVAIVLFLLSLLGTGLAPLWKSTFSAAAVLLVTSASAMLLANAVIGNMEADSSDNRVMRLAAAALAAVVAPLTLLAAVAMGLRISQYGWTPERLWGAVAVLVALAYGAAGIWSVLASAVRRRGDFAEILRPLQQRLAIAVMLLAAFLALPIVDFGAVSARSQVARLESGQVTAKEFDWTALALAYGPSGRAAVQRLTASDDAELAKAATAALAVKNRWRGNDEVRAATATALETRLRILPEGAVLPSGVREKLADMRSCDAAYMCAAYVVNDAHVVLLSQYDAGKPIDQQELVKNEAGAWRNPLWDSSPARDKPFPDLKTAVIRAEAVEKQRLTVDGQAQGLFQ